MIGLIKKFIFASSAFGSSAWGVTNYYIQPAIYISESDLVHYITNNQWKFLYRMAKKIFKFLKTVSLKQKKYTEIKKTIKLLESNSIIDFLESSFDVDKAERKDNWRFFKELCIKQLSEHPESLLDDGIKEARLCFIANKKYSEQLQQTYNQESPKFIYKWWHYIDSDGDIVDSDRPTLLSSYQQWLVLNENTMGAKIENKFDDYIRQTWYFHYWWIWIFENLTESELYEDQIEYLKELKIKKQQEL